MYFIITINEKKELMFALLQMRSSGVIVVRGPKSCVNLVMVLHFLAKIWPKTQEKFVLPVDKKHNKQVFLSAAD